MPSKIERTLRTLRVQISPSDEKKSAGRPRKPGPTVADEGPLARCYRCEKLVPVEAFQPDRSKASGRRSICINCDRERLRDAYAPPTLLRRPT